MSHSDPTYNRAVTYQGGWLVWADKSIPNGRALSSSVAACCANLRTNHSVRRHLRGCVQGGIEKPERTAREVSAERSPCSSDDQEWRRRLIRPSRMEGNRQPRWRPSTGQRKV